MIWSSARRRRAAVAAVVSLIGLAAASASAVAVGAAAGQTTAAAVTPPPPPDAPGPLGAAGRVPAAPLVTKSPHARVSDFDLGDMEYPAREGSQVFRGPLRGILAVPAASRPAKPAPLLVFGHMRTPACVGPDNVGVFAYPCPSGFPELRYDRGMRYLAEALARRGYAVLVPDLAPVLVGGAPDTAPYDQVKGWTDTITAMRDQLVAATRGGGPFGTDLTGAVETGRVAIAGHSRSGLYLPSLVTSLHARNTHVSSAFLLAAAVARDADGPFPPPLPGDMPVLGLHGTADGDVKQDATKQYLAHYFGSRRSAPSAAVTVAGLGHNYFNRSLSAKGIDDRIGCEGCPGAAVSERILTRLLREWLDVTTRGARPYLIPLDLSGRMPKSFMGHNASWFVSAAGTVLLDPSGAPTVDAHGHPLSVHGDATLRNCVGQLDPVPLDAHDLCDADTGTTTGSFLTAIGWRTTDSVSLAMPPSAARYLVLHVIPLKPATAVPIRITLADSTGHTVSVDIPEDAAALRALTDDNWRYVATVRLSLSEFRGIDREHLKRIAIGGVGTAGTIGIRGIEIH